jgi:hypothetical protein
MTNLWHWHIVITNQIDLRALPFALTWRIKENPKLINFQKKKKNESLNYYICVKRVEICVHS